MRVYVCMSFFESKKQSMANDLLLDKAREDLTRLPDTFLWHSDCQIFGVKYPAFGLTDAEQFIENAKKLYKEFDLMPDLVGDNLFFKSDNDGQLDLKLVDYGCFDHDFEIEQKQSLKFLEKLEREISRMHLKMLTMFLKMSILFQDTLIVQLKIMQQ